MKLSIIIVNYLVDDEVINCINSIVKRIDIRDYEIIIVDNSPQKTLLKKIEKIKKIQYIPTRENVGYGQACNIGAKKAKGDFIFILNPDTEYLKGSFKEIIKAFKPDTGAIAPFLKIGDKGKALQGTLVLSPLRAIFSLSFIGRLFPRNKIRSDYYLMKAKLSRFKECEILPGTAFIIRKKLFLNSGSFDKKLFLYFEEFDLFKRIKEQGYKMFIDRKFIFKHTWGASTKKIDSTKSIFEKSRFYYFKKHYGFLPALLIESCLRIKPSHILLLLIFIIAFFLRTFRLPETMIFLGDQGWFYLSAYDLLTSGKVPLVGISSSVVWLHQGPLATYFIATGLLLAKFNPLGPAYLLSIIDSLTIIVIFIISLRLFNKWIGLASALFYATSPLILISARTPYHTTLTPFFLSLLLLTISYFNPVRRGIYIFVIALISGFLVQLELSNVVLFIPLTLLHFLKIIPFKKTDLFSGTGGFVLGVLPFVLYDLTNNFVQTLGFPLWIINRTRLFFGLSFQDPATAANTPSALITVIGQLSAVFSPVSTIYLLAFFFGLALLIFSRKMYVKQFLMALLFFFIPLMTFFIHSAPGVAYFPLLFVPISLLAGFIIVTISRKVKLLVALFVVYCFWNGLNMVFNDFYVKTNNLARALPVNNYSYGFSYRLVEELAGFIKADSHTKPVSIRGEGILQEYPSSLDNLKYLLAIKGVDISNKGISYTIYTNNGNLENPSFVNGIYQVKK